MPLEIVEVDTKARLRQFIQLPFTLHQNEPYWLPTLISDDRKFFDPKTNHQFDGCDTVLAIALLDGKAVGRIMGLIHNKYNQSRNEQKARFGYFDCPDDGAIAHALIRYVENWAMKKGYCEMIGPYGFSDKDVQGLLIEGHEKMPLIDSACNPPYIVHRLEAEGYTKEIDCFTYKFPLDMSFPPVYEKVRQRHLTDRTYHLLEFTKRGQLKPFIHPVLRLVNDTYNELFGFVPMSEVEIHELASRYLPIIDPRFVKVVLQGAEVIGFILAIPNFSPGLKKSKGKLFPMGILHILRAMKRTTQLDIMLGAVRKDKQGRGLEVFMGLALIDTARKSGFEQAEVHLVLETNKPMRTEMERLGVEVDKRFRVFRKDLV